jgi:hypothetical protein
MCCQQTFENKKFVAFRGLLTLPRNFFALLPQVNFPANNLTFYLRSG